MLMLSLLMSISSAVELSGVEPELMQSTLADQSGLTEDEALAAFRGDTDLRSLLLGSFYGLMVVMVIYNLLLYYSLRDKVYLLYVGSTAFAILTTVSTNGLGEQYFWPGYQGIDASLYVVFAGISMAFSSRFAAVFLQVKDFSRRINRYLWLISGLSLLMSVMCLVLGLEPILIFARWLVLISFPSYIAIGIVALRRGYKPAQFYIIAWIPYILGIVIRTMHGAGWLPTNFFTLTSIEFGGALEVTLLSLALADRIKSMRRELRQKEFEKQQFERKLLSEQKFLLEKTVEERTMELRVANDTKDKFFSIIAHDLRNPMIALQGVGQKLEYFIRKDKQEKLLEMGAKIDQSIDQLNHLLNNLLNWATSQTGSIPYHPGEVNLKELVDENISLYTSLATTKGVEIINNIELDKCMAFVDLNTTSTIIRNLLSNALKFSPENGKVVFETALENDFVKFCIKDEGTGISQEGVSLILGEGEQPSMSGTKGEKGFGLGLKLCKEFINLNKGHFDVRSQLGNGTTFEVSLPTTSETALQ